MSFLLKPYEVTVSGYGPTFYAAVSPSQARATAWREYSEWRGTSFRDFLSLSTIRRVAPPPRFGEPILVGGRPAYFVPGLHGQYVRFVRDDSKVILNSHPADVTFVEAAA